MDYKVTNENLTSIANAIRDAGGTESGLVFPNEFVSAIRNLAPPPQKARENDVIFIDYDATILYSYSAEEFSRLDALPQNPYHEGLVAEGWNWTLADAKSYVSTYGMLTIGQLYITNDRKTRIYIELQEGWKKPALGITLDGTAVIDWGDGSSQQTITGTSSSVAIFTEHEYASGGEYTISFYVTGEWGTTKQHSQTGILVNASATKAEQSQIYRSSVKHIRIGDNCIIRDLNSRMSSLYALETITIPSELGFGSNTLPTSFFQGDAALVCIILPRVHTSSYIAESCTSLLFISGVQYINLRSFYGCNSLKRFESESITSIGGVCYNGYCLERAVIPSDATSISSIAFSGCRLLKNIVIPSSVTTIEGSAFNGCCSLVDIKIPSLVTSIGQAAFYGCIGLRSVHFKPTTPPDVANSNAWTNLPTDCTIYVPTGSLSAYTSAANYPDPNVYTYVEE